MTIYDNVCFWPGVIGPSMQPLLNSDNQKNYLLVMRPLNLPNIFVRPKMEEVLKRGDVVSLISPKNPKECFVKRVIGLPGDWVRTIRHRHKYVRVPEGHCWIEGDNFKQSQDSNTFGCVSMGLILGKAKLIVFPLAKFTVIKSELPEHRTLKKFKHNDRYLIDFKPTNQNREDEDDDDFDEIDNEDDENEDDEN